MNCEGHKSLMVTCHHINWCAFEIAGSLLTEIRKMLLATTVILLSSTNCF